jgi:DNA/RNA-binding domain of Phe-tRNA-synthetase-like protein
MKRYEFDSDTWEYAECDDGDWVRWEDAEAELEVERQQHDLRMEMCLGLEEELNEYRQGYQHLQQQAEIARLRKALESLAKDVSRTRPEIRAIAKAALEGE